MADGTKPQAQQNQINKGVVSALRQLRKQKKLTQSQLAKLAGSSADVISRIELGKDSPKLETLERLAAALDVEITLTPR